MESLIIINWTSPFTFLGSSGGTFHFYSYFNRTVCAALYTRSSSIAGLTSRYHMIQGNLFFFFFFVFVALRPMSTAMVIAGRSVHLTTLFPGQA